MSKFDYNDFAELYLGKSPLGQSMARYRRFDTAAEALRFAMEELPRDVLRGSMLEVDEERFNSYQIGELYNASQYPLSRAKEAA